MHPARQSPWSCALGKEGAPANLRKRVPTRDPTAGHGHCKVVLPDVANDRQPLTHWGCPQLQGAFQPQSHPMSACPSENHPALFWEPARPWLENRVPGGDAEGELAQGPEHPIETALGHRNTYQQPRGWDDGWNLGSRFVCGSQIIPDEQGVPFPERKAVSLERNGRLAGEEGECSGGTAH